MFCNYCLDPLEDNGRLLRYASKVSKYDIVKLLVDAYLEKSEITKEKKNKLKNIINEGDNKELTSLHYACQKKCAQTVKLLLNHGGGTFIACKWTYYYVFVIIVRSKYH